MEPKWIEISTSSEKFLTWGMNVPGGVIIRTVNGFNGWSATMVFVPKVRVEIPSGSSRTIFLSTGQSAEDFK